MYRRFLNKNDYLGIITEDALSQLTRGKNICFVQAEQAAEASIMDYLTENYEIERELNRGKFIFEYDRRISYPIGCHFYLDGKICEVIQAINGYKAPCPISYWHETEEGVNNYTIIVDNMKNNVLRPRIKLLQKQPPQSTRLEFVNAILNGFDGWKFMADLRCRKFTEDMIYQQKNSDGTKSKKKVLNPKTGGKEEKYGHLSDILDYVLVLFLCDSWRRFQNQKTTIETYTAPVYNTFEY